MRRNTELPKRSASGTPIGMNLQRFRLNTCPTNQVEPQSTRSRPSENSANRLQMKPPLSNNRPVPGQIPRTGSTRPLTSYNRSSSPFQNSQPPSAFEFSGEAISRNVEGYIFGRQIGQGAYAIVKLGTVKATKQTVAIKTYDKMRLLDPRKKQNVKREIHLLRQLSHPNIIQLFEAIETPRNIHIVMEYVNGSSLHRYVRRRSSRKVDEGEARRLFRQIVEAVKYCHDNNIAHRDIKMENIILDQSGMPKLIDFGFSTKGIDKNLKLFCGTPSYMSPEIVARKEFMAGPADVWALGILLFALLSGTFPFRGINERDLYRKILKGSFDVPDGIGSQPRILIKRMLQFNPEKRISCAEILDDSWVMGKITRSQSNGPAIKYYGGDGILQNREV